MGLQIMASSILEKLRGGGGPGQIDPKPYQRLHLTYNYETVDF